MKEAVRTEAAPAPFQGAPYSQAIKANGFVFVSGQLALKPDHAEIVGDNITDQTDTQQAERLAEEFLAREHEKLAHTTSQKEERPN